MAEPPVPEELAFEIPTESVIDLHMHWHGVLYCRDHLRRVNVGHWTSTSQQGGTSSSTGTAQAYCMVDIPCKEWTLNARSSKNSERLQRGGITESEIHSHHHVVMHRPAKTDRTMLPPRTLRPSPPVAGITRTIHQQGATSLHIHHSHITDISWHNTSPFTWRHYNTKYF